MEYFDFEEASLASNNAGEDDVASDNLEVDEADAVESYESLFFDKTFQLHQDSAPADMTGFADDEDPPAAHCILSDPVPGGDYPMFRAKEPCDFCRRMGLDCFIIQRGVLNNGCTCCVSLYRECSFTHAKARGKFLDTLHPVTEDVDIPTGGLTGKRALKSLGGALNNFDDLDGRGRKSGARFSRDAIRVLKTWLSEHYQHPYPTEQEKDELKTRTGLKRSQVCNWLANARRRGKVRPSPRSISPVAGGVDIPGRSSLSSSSSVDLSLMTPLERWKHSPPEHEAASTSAIIRAMANPPFQASGQHPQQHRQPQPQSQPQPRSLVHSRSQKAGSSNDSSYSSMFQAPSISSFDTENRSAASDFSFASAFSHRSSHNSFASMDRKDRRHRRKLTPPVPTFDRQKSRGARIFQCTFCTDSFPAKYDWQRHEKSLHLALEKWTCAPQGGIVISNDKKLCAFCRVQDPDEDHLETHNFSSCQEKTTQERTFYRKDHLNQHLRLMHNVKFDPWMEHWRITTSEIKSRCGFCSATFNTWKDRTDHLAAHFKNGADMSQWKGDWGFEPFVQHLLENAMPPYLIGQERTTLDPFKATTSNIPSPDIGAGYYPSQPDTHLPVPQDANCFQRLQRELTTFIQCQLQAGVVPTDQSIQDEGRTIVYGTNDPWNQTCADNLVWLSILKRDCGLEVMPDSEHIRLDNLNIQKPYAVAGGLPQTSLDTNPPVGTQRKSWVSHTSFDSSSDFHSPGLHSGYHSAAPSMPASLADSFVESSAVPSAAPIPGLSSGWGSSFSGGGLSSSAPIHTAADPLIQMSFDPEFLEQLNDQYGVPEMMEGLGESFNMNGMTTDHSYLPTTKDGGTFDPALPTTTGDAPIPISIPGSAVDPNLQQFADPSYFTPSSFRH